MFQTVLKSTLVMLALSLSLTSNATDVVSKESPVETLAAAGSYQFVGCYADGYDCRIQFRNGRYCYDTYLGRNWECLSQERTRPRACYCWEN